MPDEVYDQLVTELTQGGLEAGASLPSERRLAELLAVSRPAVREALQRLAHAGYVDVRQGDATTVRDFRRLGGFDLLPRLLVAHGSLDLSVARSILEARAYVGPRIAALAAERSGATLTEPLAQAIERLEADPDPVRRQHAALAFWEHIVQGADSIAFRLMFNSMRAAYIPLVDALAAAMSVEVDRVESYRALASAIVAGDANRAHAEADSLLHAATEGLGALIDEMDAR